MRGLINTAASSGIGPAVTVVFFVMFVAYVAFLYLPSRKRYFDNAAKMPLEEE